MYYVHIHNYKLEKKTGEKIVVEIHTSEVKTIAQAVLHIGVKEQTYYRLRYGIRMTDHRLGEVFNGT